MDPASLPDPLILFDGQCRLCHGMVRFVLRRDRRGRFHFAALQSPLAQDLCGRFGHDAASLQSVAVWHGGQLLLRSDATIQIARELGWPWRAAAVLRLLPRPLRDWGYGVVARNRYRWFGSRQSCALPEPEHRHRFLDG